MRISSISMILAFGLTTIAAAQAEAAPLGTLDPSMFNADAAAAAPVVPRRAPRPVSPDILSGDAVFVPPPGAVRPTLEEPRRRRPRVDVEVYAGSGYELDYAEPGYVDEGISCGAGKSIVKRSGFRHVSVASCGRRTFTYSAVRHGDLYRVKVSRYSARIISVVAID